MARLDVRRIKGVRGISLVVEMQSDLLEDIQTVIVAPLTPTDRLPPIREVNPPLYFEGQEMALRLEQLISIPRSRLGSVVGNILGDECQIVRALDRLLS